jgi:glycosyltransferase involved in cell wall biosynthesis
MPRVGQFVFSSSGGAGSVASNLNQGLVELGVDSRLVHAIRGELKDLELSGTRALGAAIVDSSIIKRRNFSNQVSILRSGLQTPIRGHDLKDFDVVHLHWTPGLINLNSLGGIDPKAKLFISLHDYWFFTGGCHFPGSCRNFEIACEQCPAVRKQFEALSVSALNEKRNFFQRHRPTVIAPSLQIKADFEASPLSTYARVILLGNPVHPVFSTIPRRDEATNSRQYLFVATNLSDPRKNVSLAIDFVKSAREKDPELSLTLVGGNPPSFDEPWISHFGKASPKELAQLLATHRALLFASQEDNAPLTLGEANRVGTPVVFVPGIPKQVARQSHQLLEGAGFMSTQEYAVEILGLYNA